MGAVIPGRSTSIVRLDPAWLTGLSFDDVNAVVFRGSHGCCGIASSGCCHVSAPRGTVFEPSAAPLPPSKPAALALRFGLFINLKIARALGLDVPPTLCGIFEQGAGMVGTIRGSTAELDARP
jgi:hypothetical protein